MNNVVQKVNVWAILYLGKYIKILDSIENELFFASLVLSNQLLMEQASQNTSMKYFSKAKRNWGWQSDFFNITCNYQEEAILGKTMAEEVNFKVLLLWCFVSRI